MGGLHQACLHLPEEAAGGRFGAMQGARQEESAGRIYTHPSDMYPLMLHLRIVCSQRIMKKKQHGIANEHAKTASTSINNKFNFFYQKIILKAWNTIALALINSKIFYSCDVKM